jgi:hypothetical protein
VGGDGRKRRNIFDGMAYIVGKSKTESLLLVAGRHSDPGDAFRQESSHLRQDVENCLNKEHFIQREGNLKRL